MRRLPKIELHLHLDCSLSFEVVSRLDPSISRARFDHEFIAPAKCTSLADFLTRAPRGFELLQSREALRLVTEDLFAELAADNVIYAEIRFAPLLHTRNGLTPTQVVETVERATADCIRSTGIKARLILCTLSHFTAAQSLETVGLVAAFQDTNVVALDIAGDEAGFPIDAHIPAYRRAIELGLHRTAHAGEAAGPASVWETIRHFRPARIGHGVRSIEDPALVAHLRGQGIHLEVCPASNVQTCVCETFADHPINRLYEAGVSLGISTDCRTITDITLNEEYAKLAAAFDWTETHFLRCNQNSARAAFLPASQRAALLSRLTQADNS